MPYNSDMEDLQTYLLGSWARAKTNTINVWLKQLTSFVPYSEGKDKMLFLKHYGEGIANWNETRKFMLSISEYLQFRYSEKEYNKIYEILNPNDNILIKMADKVNISKKLNLTSLATYGDMLSVIYGGYARYKTSLDMGLSHEEALKDFERQTVTTQQSELKSLRSNIMKRSGLLNILHTLFRSQEQQYLSKSSMALIDVIKGETKANTKEALIIYNLVVPILMTLVQGVLNNLMGKEDKDWLYYFKEFLANSATSFFGLNYAYFTLKNLLYSYKYFNTKKLLLNTIDTMTGLPAEYYERLLFERKDIDIDLYEKEKKKRAGKKKEMKEKAKKVYLWGD
jgi:hypothetical protein